MRNIKSMRIVAVILMCVMLCAAFAGCAPQAHVHTYSNGKCSECGAKCEHTYSAGVCTVCGYACEHDYYADGECVECGKLCAHEYIKGICVVCGFECIHTYTDGECVSCGVKCKHDYENGVCKVCDIVCTHSFVNGVCKTCALVCMHNYVNGKCADCGKECEHTYVDGVCSVCNTVCGHKQYENGVCAECGHQCEHDYVNGVCAICGHTQSVSYDYTVNYADELPRINICTVDAADAGKLMTTADMGFNGQPGSKDNRPYYECTITVDHCAEEYELTDVAADVKIRGNYTANYPKKPFRIKFNKKQGMLGLNGGQKFKSWVLLADYKDIAMTRNALTFYLSKQILGSDGYYSTDFLPVELYLNNEYWGMYLLVEQQQVNSGRVDITEPEEDYKGTDIGYMIEYDGYFQLEAYAERFTCDYNGGKPLKARNGSNVYPPSGVGYTIKNDVYYDDEQTCAQKHFIKGYVSNLYKLCYEAVYNHNYLAFSDDKTELVKYTPQTSDPVRETIERVIDVRSLVDVYIINEIACDADIAWSSFYMDVDFGAKGDGVMRFEAPWDFDSALGLKYSCASGQGLFAANSDNPWLVVFINESWFWDEIKLKWREMNAAKVMDVAREFIRLGRIKYASAYQHNFDKWGFVKSGELNSTAMQIKNHAGAVDHLYNWFDTRIKYLDTQWL